MVKKDLVEPVVVVPPSLILAEEPARAPPSPIREAMMETTTTKVETAEDGAVNVEEDSGSEDES